MMKPTGISGIALLATLALAAVTTESASALPDTSVTLAGSSYPTNAQGRVSAASVSLGTASGVALEGKGATLLLSTRELTALGEFTVTLTNVVNPKNKEQCHTAGDVPDVVLASGVFHVVYINLSPLTLGVLLSFNEFELTCGKVEVLVKGSVISSLAAGTESEELGTFGETIHGSAGKQSLTEYYNDSGTIKKSELLSNAGSGFILSDLNVSEEFKPEVLEGKMITITGR